MIAVMAPALAKEGEVNGTPPIGDSIHERPQTSANVGRLFKAGGSMMDCLAGIFRGHPATRGFASRGKAWDIANVL